MADNDILNRINSPEDIKNLNSDEDKILAKEIREKIVDVVSRNGGHLASNLGVVELTIALHKVFNSPDDKIIFDVGHQVYPHKIITGRKDKLDTLRKNNGLSGFPKREESFHDVFNTGHASTSISAALGIMRANKICGKNDSVVAVIGDGSLTGGLAFEGLNDAGQSGLPLIVVLNDNDMAISKSVGALSHTLTNMRSSIKYQNIKGNIKNKLGSIPAIGKGIVRFIERVKRRIKYMLVPNVFFESMGFAYIGPVDGHDIKELTIALKKAKAFNRPTIVHAVTIKGMGYEPAQNNPSKFHGIGAFDKESGEVKNKAKTSNSKEFAKTLIEIAEKNDKVVAITAAMPDGTGLIEFAKRFPDRFFDVGIAEQHAVTMAAGMASGGIKPVVAIYSTFLQRAYDEILHDVCLQKLPVMLAVDRAGLVGDDGETHQGVYDIAYLLTMPNMIIMSPSSVEELRNMIRLGTELDSPCAVRYNKGLLESSKNDAEEIIVGKWKKIKDINAITVIATGRLVQVAKNACDEDVGLINARFINPMDKEMLDEIGASAKKVITIEDGIASSGMGIRISEYLSHYGVETYCMGVRTEPVVQGKVSEQDELCHMTCEDIKNKIDELRNII